MGKKTVNDPAQASFDLTLPMETPAPRIQAESASHSVSIMQRLKAQFKDVEVNYEKTAKLLRHPLFILMSDEEPKLKIKARHETLLRTPSQWLEQFGQVLDRCHDAFVDTPDNAQNTQGVLGLHIIETLLKRHKLVDGNGIKYKVLSGSGTADADMYDMLHQRVDALPSMVPSNRYYKPVYEDVRFLDAEDIEVLKRDTHRALDALESAHQRFLDTLGPEASRVRSKSAGSGR